MVSVAGHAVPGHFGRIVAPRFFRVSSSSSTRIPAPSPITKPSRSRSTAARLFRIIIRVESARIAANPPTPMDVNRSLGSAGNHHVGVVVLDDAEQIAYQCALVVQAVAVASFGPFARTASTRDRPPG